MLLIILETSETESKRIIFEKLYKKYFDVIQRQAEKIVKDIYLSEEIAQDVFIYLLDSEQINQIKHINSHETKTLLMRITEKIILDKQKEQEKEKMLLKTKKNCIKSEFTSNSIEKAIEEVRLSELITMIKELPELYQKVFIKHYLQEKSYQEIADSMNISQETIRKRVERARRKLRIIYKLKDE